jgi:hypothetical protein
MAELEDALVLEASGLNRGGASPSMPTNFCYINLSTSSIWCNIDCMSEDINATSNKLYDLEATKLEIVTACVGFDDVLDVTLTKNHPHCDTYIVVTSHADKKTQKVARKHGAFCVTSDLFRKNGRNFNKGAAINAGFDYFQWHGWRLHLDADIILPDNFKRILFNHTHLERNCIYGADRMNVIGTEYIKDLFHSSDRQHTNRLTLGPSHGEMGHRLVCSLRDYLPCGFFQLWHSSCQKPYPYSLGTAAHDDMMFSALWPTSCRRHLPSVVCYHLVANSPKIGENWDGFRKQPRIDGIMQKGKKKK